MRNASLGIHSLIDPRPSNLLPNALHGQARLVALMMKKFAEDEENERLGEMRRAANREKFKGEIKEQRQLRLELYAKVISISHSPRVEKEKLTNNCE